MEGPATSTVDREEVAENVAVRSVGGGGVRARNLSVVSTEGDTVVKLHQTNIVIARANGNIELSSGGWRTFQTLKGINQSLRSVSGLQVVADGPVAEGSWRVTNGTEWSTPFVDGMTVPGFDAATLPNEQVSSMLERMSVGAAGGERAGGGNGCDAREERGPLPSVALPRTDTPVDLGVYDDIPVEVSGDDCPAPIETFAGLGLHPTLAENLVYAKFVRPTPVQRHAVPIAIARRDLMACAQTGSGKTGAFLLPTLQTLLMDLDTTPELRSQCGRCEPGCIVLAPTRELATQTHREAKKLAHGSAVRPALVYGGADIRSQIRTLERGCQLLVATPGRLCDLLERGKLHLFKVRHLVLDEADRMLDMGFEYQVRRVVEREGMPRPGQRQTLMLSATYPHAVQQLAAQFMSNYIFVSVGRVGSTTALIKQTVLWAAAPEKRRLLLEQLETCAGRTVIFVETKGAADELGEFLASVAVPAASIHGGRSQKEREAALLAFRRGQPHVLVATDVAARGIDVPECTSVINFELPRDIDSFVHRVGRTGRMGRLGHAISLFGPADRPLARPLVSLLQEAGQEIPEWLRGLSLDRSHGRRWNGRGGSKFGSRDIRSATQVRRYAHPAPSPSTGGFMQSSFHASAHSGVLDAAAVSCGWPQHGYLGVQPRAGYSTGLLSQEYFDGCEPYYCQQEHPAESRASSGAVDISGSLL